MNMTRHAEVRQQQRAVPPLIVDWLEAYGTEKYDHHGAVVQYFTKRSRRQLERVVGSQVIRQMSRWLDAYLVRSLADGRIITVGYRQKPIKH